VDKPLRKIAFFGCLIGAHVWVSGCASRPTVQMSNQAEVHPPDRTPTVTPTRVACKEADDATPEPTTAQPGAEWGIEVSGLRLSAAGYMLDFRYQITDLEKAKPFMDPSVKPYLIDQATGAKMYVPSPPKIGSLRQTSRQPKPGRSYFVLFANPGRFVKRGSAVTIAMGACELRDLIVE
jgi:hypothetical protein